jgi:Flp pilus assembly pilin Flp
MESILSEEGQGMVEYLLILSLVVLTIVAMFAAFLHGFG